MNGDLLQNLLSDESVTRTLLDALPKQDSSAVSDASNDRSALLYTLAQRLPPREKALAEKLLLALLLVSLFAKQEE